jgi:hypothetical protein
LTRYLVIVLCTVLPACGPATDRDGASDATAGKKFLSLGTAPPGGAFFVVGGALAEVLNEHRQDNGWELTAEATKGSQENIRRLETGEIDFALSNSAITYFAVRGEEGWEEKYPIQTVMTLAPNIAMFITQADSRLKTIADLKGQRVVVGPAGAGFEYFVRPLVEAHGVRFEDFTPLYATQAAAVDLLTDRSAAAIFIGGAVPTASVTQAATSMDVFFIPFTKEAQAEVMRRYPFFLPATVPAGTYRGLEQDFETVNVGAMHLVTAANQDEDLVYRVTRILYEGRERVTEKHAAGRSINAQNVVRHTGTDFHPGAIRYYREMGIWPDTGPAPSSAEGRLD